MGHGMGDGGASAAQHYAATAAAKAAKVRLVLLAGFLERVWRPEAWWIFLLALFDSDFW